MIAHAASLLFQFQFQVALSAPMPSPGFGNILAAHSKDTVFNAVHSVAANPKNQAVLDQQGTDAQAAIASFLAKVGGPSAVSAAIKRGRATGQKLGVQQSLLAGVATASGQSIPATSVQGTPNTLAMQFAAGQAPIAAASSADGGMDMAKRDTSCQEALGDTLTNPQYSHFFTDDSRSCLSGHGLKAAELALTMTNESCFTAWVSAMKCK